MKANKAINIRKAGYMAAVLIGAASFSSCVDMDLAPTNEPSEESVWSSPTLAVQAANGIYNEFTHTYRESWNCMWQPFSACVDRDANWTDFNHTYGRVTTTDGYVNGRWGSFYKAALRANSVIDGLAGVPGMDEAQRQKLTCEAKFIRAWAYYMLNVLYHGVPYIKEAISSPADANMPRETMDQVWDDIIKDLNDCIGCPNFPDKYPQGSSQWGHVTKSCAYALRGKVYMWKKEWHNAELDFRAVERCGHKLYTADGPDSFKTLLTQPNEDCDEMIYSVCYSPDVTYGNGLHRAFAPRSVYGGEGWTNFVINPWFVDLFENADGSRFNWDDVIPGYNQMSTQARRVYFLRDNLTADEIAAQAAAGADMSKYLPQGNEARIYKAYENRDPRLNMSVITPYHKFLGGKRNVAEEFTWRFPFHSDGELDLRTDISAMAYYVGRKFVLEGIQTPYHYSYCDVPIIRFGEVVLHLAECLNEQGDYNGAAEQINRLRARAGAALLNSNEATKVKGVDDMRERIIREMYYEIGLEDDVYFEELRHHVWRQNKFYVDREGQMNGMRQVWGTPTYKYIDGGETYYSWPIPEQEVQNNPAMTQSPEWM